MYRLRKQIIVQANVLSTQFTSLQNEGLFCENVLESSCSSSLVLPIYKMVVFPHVGFFHFPPK